MISSSYVPIQVAVLTPSTSARWDLFQPHESLDRWVLYRRGEDPLTASDLQQLRQRGVSELYIEPQNRQQYQQYLRVVAMPGAEDPAVAISCRAQALSLLTRDVLAGAFERRDDNATVAAANELGVAIAALVCEDEFAVQDLSRGLCHDASLFTHSTNVGMYAAILARQLGFVQSDIELIASGGLLHDVGMLGIDQRVLAKRGRLSIEEYREVQRHPVVGLVQLAACSDLTQGQLLMVYQHHERLDGSGYPVGVVDDEIHCWAKLCAVVDVFAALTSDRAHRSAMPKLQALECLQRDLGNSFDPEILACWVEITRSCWHD